ncbi:MAG: ferrochelatase [Alteromonadaceae bacterium]|nr:ferrochelatase [Alteromonadaceae bacterium]
MARFTAADSAPKELIAKNGNRTGVLLTNLGTPDAPTSSALRRYLNEFLSDPRVVEIPKFIWLFILHGIILRFRPAKSAKLYQSIWTDEGSPLLVNTQAQQEKVKQRLAQVYGEDVLVSIGMRYGSPSIVDALKDFQQQGVTKIVVLPLYPQYAGATTGSTFDSVVKEVKKWRWVPSFHFLSSYHDHPLYIKALANTITEYIAEHGKPDKFIFSYHGMPKLFHQRGDPYFDFCHKTTELLIEKLGFSEDDYVMTFQSRFGKAPWLTPYTDEVLENLPGQGIKKIAIISPAFSSDCLETLEELKHENLELFINAGGEQYHYIDALNDRDDHIDTIVEIIKPSLL